MRPTGSICWSAEGNDLITTDWRIRDYVLRMAGIPSLVRHRMRPRRIHVGLVVTWFIAGGAVMWPWTANCFATFSEFGFLTGVGSCAPLAGLALVVWLMTGGAIGLVLYYWTRIRGTSQH